MALPNTYQKLEYIESTGVQYIDIGYQPNYNTEIRTKFAHNEHTIDTPLFGVRGESSSNQFTLWTHPTLYSSNPAGIAIFNSTEQNLTNLAEGTIIEFEYSNTGGEYGSQTWTWTPSSGGPGLNMCLFGLNNNGTIDSRKFSGKLWYFQIYESGTLLMDLQPCYRKSDNEIGLYDLVNDVFYTNDGSGRFTKAPSKIQRIYVGTTKVRPQDVELYYDLKGGSDAGLVAAGFTGIWTNGSTSWYSDGLGQTNTSNDRSAVVYVNGIDLSQAKKITFWSNGYWKNASWSNAKRVGLWTNWASNSGTHPRWFGQMNMANNSGYQNNGMFLSDSSGTNVISQNGQMNRSTGDTKQTITLDLVNKTATYVQSGANNTTRNATLTDEYVTWTRAMTTFYFQWERGYSSENNERLKEVYIKIE